jgi:hypothetical protein
METRVWLPASLPFISWMLSQQVEQALSDISK